jgi:hypothetical protein
MQYSEEKWRAITAIYQTSLYIYCKRHYGQGRARQQDDRVGNADSERETMTDCSRHARQSW